MKKPILSFILFFLAGSLLWKFSPPRGAQAQQPPPAGTQRTGPITGRYEEILGLTNKAADNPQVKMIIQRCQAEAMQKAQAEAQKSKEGATQPTLQALEALEDQCIKEKFAELPPATAKQIAGQAPIDPDVQDNLKYKSNPAYQQLQDYLSQRLREALYGSIDNTKVKRLVDHKTFYDLFKTQLGKNIISTLTSYCVNADENGLIYSNSEARKAVRAANIAKLAEASQDPNKAGGNQGLGQGAQMGSSNEGFQHFNGCIQKITHICGGTTWNVKTTDGKLVPFNYGSDEIFGSAPKEDIDYTRSQACVVTRELKRLRKSLLSIKKTEDRLRELKSDRDYQNAVQFGGFEGIYGDRRKVDEKSIDDLTSLTTNEFANKAKMSLKLKEQAAIFERECVQNSGSPRCQEMLTNNQDYNKFLKMKDEYNARTQMVKGKIMTMTDNEIKQFLMDEGRTQQEVNMILQKAQQSQDAKQLKEKIADIYEKERMAIVVALNKKLEDSNIQMGHLAPSTAGQAGGGTPPDQQKAQELRTAISQRLQNVESEVRDTLLFNNMVSGYLSVEDGKGRTQTNSSAAHRELNDSAFNPANRGPTAAGPPPPPPTVGGTPVPVPTIDPKFFTQLQATTKQNLPGAPNTKDADATVIEVQTLNTSILGNYLDSDPDAINQLNNANKAQRQQEKSTKSTQDDQMRAQQPNNPINNIPPIPSGGGIPR